MTTTRDSLQHRPFAVLADHLHDPNTAPSATAIRAEIRALVSRGALSRRAGDDVLARLALHTEPYRWAVGVTVPVSITVRAPNARYAQRVGTAQLVAALGRLRNGYLAAPATPVTPAEDPATRSLLRIRTERTDPHPGYPVGGVYRIDADALLAITVTGDDPDTVWAAARTRLGADLDRQPGFSYSRLLMRQTAVRRLSVLDLTVEDAADDQPDATAPPLSPRRRPG